MRINDKSKLIFSDFSAPDMKHMSVFYYLGEFFLIFLFIIIRL